MFLREPSCWKTFSEPNTQILGYLPGLMAPIQSVVSWIGFIHHVPGGHTFVTLNCQPFSYSDHHLVSLKINASLARPSGADMCRFCHELFTLC